MGAGTRFKAKPLWPNQSVLTTSPPIEVPKACQVVVAIEFWKKRTLPSQSAAFTPPVCLLRAPWRLLNGLGGAVLVVEHGEFSGFVVSHQAPVMMSASDALGP